MIYDNYCNINGEPTCVVTKECNDEKEKLMMLLKNQQWIGQGIPQKEKRSVKVVDEEGDIFQQYVIYDEISRVNKDVS